MSLLRQGRGWARSGQSAKMNGSRHSPINGAAAATLYEPAFAVLTQRCPTLYCEAITTLMLVLAASGVVAVVAFWAARPPGRSRNDVAG